MFVPTLLGFVAPSADFTLLPSEKRVQRMRAKPKNVAEGNIRRKIPNQ
jgi:hypothetical protein